MDHRGADLRRHSRRSHHRLVEFAVADKWKAAGIEKLIMPPLVPIEIPSRQGHQPKQQEPVSLCRRRDVEVSMVRQGCEVVEPGAHFERASIAVDQGQIDGHAARVWRTAARIGEKIGVGGMVPQDPLRFGRPERIEDPEPEAERPCRADRHTRAAPARSRAAV